MNCVQNPCSQSPCGINADCSANGKTERVAERHLAMGMSSLIEEGRAASTVKVHIKKFGCFLSMSQQAVSADIIPN